ncbi:MAG: hypothetical protein R2774_06340 [Saprospiraceae bacterium]
MKENENLDNLFNKAKACQKGNLSSNDLPEEGKSINVLLDELKSRQMKEHIQNWKSELPSHKNKKFNWSILVIICLSFGLALFTYFVLFKKKPSPESTKSENNSTRINHVAPDTIIREVIPKESQYQKKSIEIKNTHKNSENLMAYVEYPQLEFTRGNNNIEKIEILQQIDAQMKANNYNSAYALIMKNNIENYYSIPRLASIYSIEGKHSLAINTIENYFREHDNFEEVAFAYLVYLKAGGSKYSAKIDSVCYVIRTSKIKYPNAKYIEKVCQ